MNLVFLLESVIFFLFQPMLCSSLKSVGLHLKSFGGSWTRNFSSSQCWRMKPFSEWSFTQPGQLREFALDQNEENYVRLVRGAVFSPVKPTPLKTDLQLVSVSIDATTDILDLDNNVSDDEQFVKFAAGNLVLPGSLPVAHRYGGHQFGYWADQLGDGRAILLGEYLNMKGERWELQLKGSGRTPYSRGGDGRAVLRSSIREFLCSEAMYSLGIPTSRAAAIVVSKDGVIRDQFYNGRIQLERAAVVLRLAPTWFRIGSLQILNKENEIENLKQIIDFVLKNYYPEIPTGDYLAFFKTVVTQSCSLVSKWMAVGFAHGVLNTDNMSLLSITIDYGPFGFLDAYDPTFTPNHSDDEGRYSYAHQPSIFKWNLARLADALEPIVSTEDAQSMLVFLENFDIMYKNEFSKEMRLKLGVPQHPDEDRLVRMLMFMMESQRADMTQTFRQLGEIDLDTVELTECWALQSLSQHAKFQEFINLYRKIRDESNVSESERKATMARSNPRYVLRNWMAEAAIRQAETDDFQLTRTLMRILRNPYEMDQEAEQLAFSKPPPCWSKSLRVSCSS